MNRFVMAAAVALLGTLAVPGAAGAAPKLKAVPALQGGRLVVTVTSAKRFTTKTRPRAVKVAAGGATYRLALASRSSRRSVWRTGRLTDAQLGALSWRTAMITVKTAAGTVTRRRGLPAAPVPAPAPITAPPPVGGTYTPPPVPTPPSAPELTVPGFTLVRDDAAGRAALGTDLLLEHAETPIVHRIFLYGTGVVRQEGTDGGACDASAKTEGTWGFLRGYAYTENGGGVIVQIASIVNSVQARTLLVFPGTEPNAVYVGSGSTRYERTPGMASQC